MAKKELKQNEKKEKIEFDLNADISEMIPPQSERRQSLEGFDDDYTDIVDYIVRCTYKIWDEKNVGLVYTHYHHKSLAHMPHGLVYGRDDVVAATAAAQNAFPDFKLYVDDVLWRGNDQEGFDTSMPSTAVGTNLGWSMYGPPTGKKICRRGIANCFIRKNRIIEEWVVHDDVTTVQQLGFDLDETVKKLVADGYCDDLQAEVGPIERIHGEGEPPSLPPKPSNPEDVEGLIRRAIEETFNWRLFGKVDEYYNENYQYHGSRNQTFYGRDSYKKQLLQWISLFPDAHLSIDDIYWNGNAKDGFRSSTRWTLRGTHRGNGVFGPPSNLRVEIMGITNHVIKDGRFTEELTLFNELETMVRIERARQKSAGGAAEVLSAEGTTADSFPAEDSQE
jgi:hypothetical protein